MENIGECVGGNITECVGGNIGECVEENIGECVEGNVEEYFWEERHLSSNKDILQQGKVF